MTWTIVLTLSVALISGDPATTNVSDNAASESTWINTQPNQGNLVDYLQRQYDLGESAGKPAYVYLYADWCRSCVVFRERAKGGALKRLLDQRRIVMLEFEQVNDQLGAEAQYTYAPLLIKITQGGGLGAFTLPDQEAEGPASRRLRHLIEFFAANDEM